MIDEVLRRRCLISPERSTYRQDDRRQSSRSRTEADALPNVPDVAWGSELRYTYDKGVWRNLAETFFPPSAYRSRSRRDL